MTFSADCVTTMAEAKVTRLPPVRLEKPTLDGVADQHLHLAVIDAQQLGGDVGRRGARAADVGMAGHDHDSAVLVDADLRARFAAGIEPVAARHAAALVGLSGAL